MKWIILALVLCLSLFAVPSVFSQDLNLSKYAEAGEQIEPEQAQVLLQKLQDNQEQINDYLEGSGVPAPLKAFASGRYTVHVGNETVGIVMEGGKLEEVKEGGVENPTSEIWADEDLIEKIATSDDPVGTILEAQKTGELKKEDYGLIPKIKGFLMSIALKILGLFT